LEKSLSIVQCYKCRKIGHYSKKCPNLPTLPIKKKLNSFTRRFFTKEEGKTQVHLIELMNERRKEALMGLERSLEFFKDVVGVMAQTKRLVEDTTNILTQMLKGSRKW